MAYKIIDNFLSNEEFLSIQEFFLSARMPWYYNNHVVYADEEKKDKNAYQFVHVMYIDNAPHGIGVSAIQPILDKLKVFSLIRTKINFQPIREKHYMSAFHQDDYDLTTEEIPYTVGVFYLTTNNGSTHIKGVDTPIMSVANRMVLMSGDLSHAGCSSTDERRVVLNLNFINKETKGLYEHRRAED